MGSYSGDHTRLFPAGSCYFSENREAEYWLRVRGEEGILGDLRKEERTNILLPEGQWRVNKIYGRIRPHLGFCDASIRGSTEHEEINNVCKCMIRIFCHRMSRNECSIMEAEQSVGGLCVRGKWLDWSE